MRTRNSSGIRHLATGRRRSTGARRSRTSCSGCPSAPTRAQPTRPPTTPPRRSWPIGTGETGSRHREAADRVAGERLFLDAAEAAITLLVVADGLVQVLAVEVGPEHRREPEFGVGGL